MLKEINDFLESNLSEIVTIILEDYVKAPQGLTKVSTFLSHLLLVFIYSNAKNGLMFL